MKLPQYASGVPSSRLVRFTCRRSCGIRRFGRTSKRDWPFCGPSSDPQLFVTCLVCAGVQGNSQDWERVFPYEPEEMTETAGITLQHQSSTLHRANHHPSKATGVWCTKCRSNFAANREAITEHYRLAHRIEPSETLIAHVLINTYARAKWPAKPKSAKAASSAANDTDHERRWRGVIQGGAPGSGKRR